MPEAATKRHSLEGKIVRGGISLTAFRVLRQVLGLSKIVILARLLTPNEFGVMGTGLLILSIVETFSQTGFQEALVQRKENPEAYFDSAWTLLLLRGLALYLALFLLAPVAAGMFKSGEARAVIQVLGLSVVIRAFSNIGVVRLQRELNLSRYAVYLLSGAVVDFVATVLAALVLKTVWALVIGQLIGDAAMVLASYLIHRWRPRLDFDLIRMKELWRFGRWVTGSSVLVFLLTEGDDFLVGTVLGTTALGLYQMAYRISNLPATEITSVVSQVSFPAFSLLQSDLRQVRETYLKVLRLTSIVSLFIAGLIFALAHDFTSIFLGDKWIGIVPSIQILVWWGVVRGFTGAMTPVFLALNKGHIVAKLQAYQVVFLFAAIYPLTRCMGITGASLAVLGSSLIMFFVRNRALIKEISCNNNEFYAPMAICTAVTALATTVLAVLRSGLKIHITPGYFVAEVLVFTLTSLLLFVLVRRWLHYDLLSMFKRIAGVSFPRTT